VDEWSLPSSSTTTTSQQQLAPTMFEAAPRISSVSPILPYLSASPPPPTDGGFVVPPMMTSSPPPPTTAAVKYNDRAAAVGGLEQEEFELPSDQFQLSDQVGKHFFGYQYSGTGNLIFYLCLVTVKSLSLGLLCHVAFPRPWIHIRIRLGIRKWLFFIKKKFQLYFYFNF